MQTNRCVLYPVVVLSVAPREGSVAPTPTTERENVHFSVTLPRDLVALLDAVADERGVKRSAMVREACLLWKREHQKQRRGRVA